MEKKIIYISVRSDYGGGPAHIFQLLTHINRKMFLPFIAAPDYGCYAVKFRSKVSGYFKLPHRKFSLITLIGLCRFIKKNRIDLIHCHGKGGGIYGRLAGYITRQPVIYTFHGIHYIGVMKKFYLLLEKILSNISMKIIHVSNSEEQLAYRLKLHKREKSIVIYNGIDIYQFSNVTGRNRIRVEFDIKDNEFVIGTVARFNYQKGIELSLEIIKNLKKYIPVRYMLVGDGEEREKIEKKIIKDNLSEIVIITGFRKDIPDLLSALDVYLSTSRWEGLPYTLLEANAMRVPVVASDVPGNSEVIKDGDTGYLIKLDRNSEFVEKIINIYKNPGLRTSFTRNAYSNIEKLFNIYKMVEETEKIYKKALKL